MEELKRIKEEEKKSRELIEKARNEWADQLEEAKKEASELIEKARKEALHKNEKVLMKARMDALDESKNIEKKARKELSKLVQDSSPKIVPASKKLLKGLLDV